MSLAESPLAGPLLVLDPDAIEAFCHRTDQVRPLVDLLRAETCGALATLGDDDVGYLRGHAYEHARCHVAMREGIAVGIAQTWEPSDREVLLMNLAVAPAARRLGYGRALVAAALSEAARGGRRSVAGDGLEGSTATAAFAASLGATTALTYQVSALSLSRVSWEHTERLRRRGHERHPELTLVFAESCYADTVLENAVRVRAYMNTAPRERYQRPDDSLGPAAMLGKQRAWEAEGRTHWTLFAARADGEFIAFTDLLWRSDRPRTVFYQQTAVSPEWRRRGVAEWLKAEMLTRLRELPGAREVRTANVVSNVGIARINQGLGFVPVSRHVKWQLPVPNHDRLGTVSNAPPVG